MAVGSCDDVTCTVRRNANFAHSAFQKVPHACLQLLCHGRCFRAPRRVRVGVKWFKLQRMQLLIVPEVKTRISEAQVVKIAVLGVVSKYGRIGGSQRVCAHIRRRGQTRMSATWRISQTRNA